ncbi:hypothetical protein CL619_01970 [archaeon]|nr:hypothetical protein [archaeon]|tara:strand:- start:302 stop:865 length:564 start_codon:yes stop_codon:yes gene_type:complete
MTSDYELIGQGKGYAQVVYEDKHFVAFVQEKAIAPGQITIIPRTKYTILEMFPSQLLSELFTVIKKVSEAVFETLKCHGTNVLVENGVSAGQDQPVMSVHVIPRFTDDGIPLEWEPKQLEEFDMDDALSQLTAAAITLGEDVVKDGPEATEEDDEESDKEGSDGKETEGKSEKEEENYLIQSLRKIP